MLPFYRLTRAAPRALIRPLATNHIYPKRAAHQSYGNDQSGHEKDENATNPKADLEHPGPEAPATKNSSSSSSENKSSKGSPAIHRPESAAEKDDPEVKKHNEEMAQRSDRSVNQLSEEDNKVDKKFWKGDVGTSQKAGEK